MRRQAFTLIELLVAVAMIAILAAIAVPNFLEAQVRSKVSRVATDMSAVEVGLRAYYADYRVYPRSRPEVVEMLHAAWTFQEDDLPTASSISGEPFAPWEQGPYTSAFWRSNHEWKIALIESGRDLTMLTTPVAYVLHRLPEDPFAQSRESFFVYTNPLQAVPDLLQQSNYPRYLLLSYGPDSDQSVPSDMLNPMRGPYVVYDPTNGTVSQGDLWRDGLH